MFPNVRLMIAATLASVVALICGFGLFAMFRVSHEPFVRLAVATAPLQLVADNAATSPVVFASAAPFGYRVQINIAPNAAMAADAPAPASEPRLEADAAPAAAPPDAAAPDKTPAPAGETTEPPFATVMPASAAPAIEVPAVAAAEPPARDQTPIAAAPPPDAAASTSAANAGTALPSADPVHADSDQAVEPPAVTMSSAEASPSGAADITANEPPTEPLPPGARANPAGGRAGADNPTVERTQKAAVKKPKRPRAARIRRVQRLAMARYSQLQYLQSQYQQTQYAPTAEQNFGETQVNFQAAPQPQTQFLVRRAVRVRHVRVAAKAPARPRTGIGGPFVRAPSP